MTERRFEPAPCRYTVPADFAADVECGYLTVPASRSAASGGVPFEREIRLYVSIVRCRAGRRRPDPVIWLSGGPGGNSSGLLAALDQPFAREAFLAERDLIIFDQRGTGFSEPGLFAPEADAERAAAVLEHLTTDERRRRFVTAALRDRERLVAEEVNLAAFNTVESAADIDDLRRALGYEQVNLYGISYGTRLALAGLRDTPAGIRGVILDSTVPMQVSQYAEGIANTWYSFDLLLERVAADPRANAAFPDLRERFLAFADRLDAQPDWVTFDHPVTGASLRLPVTGELIIGALGRLFYSTAAIPTLPRRMRAMLAGDYGTVIDVVRPLFESHDPAVPPQAGAGYFCINCCDDKVSPAIAHRIAAQAAAHPRMTAVPLMEFHLGDAIIPLCGAWGARRPGPAEHEPVTSAVPTLILAGEYDQNTPASWGRLAAETLPNSHYIEFPGTGHGVLRSRDCAAGIARAFLADPTTRPDDSPARAIPPPHWLE